MKRYISMILVVFLLMACIFVETPMARATGKTVVSRSIAIVFDNSGSMYEKQNKKPHHMQKSSWMQTVSLKVKKYGNATDT